MSYNKGGKKGQKSAKMGENIFKHSVLEIYFPPLMAQTGFHYK